MFDKSRESVWTPDARTAPSGSTWRDKRWRSGVLAGLVAVSFLALAACSGGGGGSSSSSSASGSNWDQMNWDQGHWG